jgi:formiminoglutamase
LLISVPHAGVEVPANIRERLSDEAGRLPDTDWYVDRLYRFAQPLGAGTITAHYSRYVIDLNRPPDDAALYQSKTPGLVPLQTFSGADIYAANPPGESEKRERLEQYWRPYHDAIREELDQVRAKHGYAILFDAHSICSRVPELFEGLLPDLNLGSYGNSSAADSLVDTAMQVFRNQQQFSFVLNGRFKGGYITRHYGQPENSIHALQLEMSQAVYMKENPPEYVDEYARMMEGLLRKLIAGIMAWNPDNE